MPREKLSRLQIFLFVPNLIDYLRFLLIGLAWINISQPITFIVLYVMSAALDSLDGYAARKLSQVSDLGAFLDVIVDVIGRGVVWCNVTRYGLLVPLLELLTFHSNSMMSKGSEWKTRFEEAPAFVKAVMANGFRTPLGTFVISGLHVFPIAIYFCQNEVLHFTSYNIMIGLTVILAIGRLLCLVVECWCILTYLNHMVDNTIKDAT